MFFITGIFLDREKLLVFGGRTTTEMALNDCYILDITEKRWEKVNLQLISIFYTS